MPLTTGPSMVAALEPLLATLDCSQGVRLIGVHAQKLSEEALRAPRLFDDGEIAALGRKSARALDRVFSVAQRLNGIGVDQVDVAKKG